MLVIRILLCLCATPLNKDSRARPSAGVHGAGSMSRARDGAEQTSGGCWKQSVALLLIWHMAYENVLQKAMWKPLKTICSSTASS